MPNGQCELALGELEPATRARLTVLLTLDRAGIAGQEAGLLQRGAELGVQLAERAAEAVTDRAGLARKAATAKTHNPNESGPKTNPACPAN